MDLIDNYRHPIPNVHYIKESILGPGGDRDAFYTWFETTCACFEEADCVSNCECTRTYSNSYRNGLLTSEEITNEHCIYECSAFCSCGEFCHNRVVQRGPNPFLEIRETGTKGYGIFAKKTFPPGTFIAEYAGELISSQVAEERCRVQGKNKYILVLKEHYVDNVFETYLDAFSYGNVARYINHSCSPNCSVIPVRTGCIIPKAAIFSNRVIEENEELTYCYNRDSIIMSSTVCLCNTSSCKGFLPSTIDF